jgi:hypothetical protein
MEGLTRWVSSTDWLSRPADKFPYPTTWLNGQRWNDLPSAVSKPLAKGELKVRESTADEKAAARFNQEIMRLRKLPQNLRATDDELADKARDALRAA